MKVKNRRLYRAWYRGIDKTTDPVLGLSVFVLAERWAEAIESRMEAGQPLQAAAAEAHRAATAGAAGALMHTSLGDLMVEFLDECWAHGGELRTWYESQGA